MRAGVLLAVVLLIGGCGGGTDDEAGRPGGQPLSVQEALESDVEGPLLVRGSLVATGDDVRLCSALAESYPPQCGEPSLRVENADFATVAGPLSEARGVTWSEEPVALRGDVEDGVLRLSATLP